MHNKPPRSAPRVLLLRVVSVLELPQTRRRAHVGVHVPVRGIALRWLRVLLTGQLLSHRLPGRRGQHVAVRVAWRDLLWHMSRLTGRRVR